MNIYMQVEIAARELDSKLLLAVLAAARGHEVMLSDLSTFEFLRGRRRLVPGVFHTKSITPSDSKNRRHAALRDEGYAITSIDEESGLLDDRYELFARRRFSDSALRLVDAAFCWGPMDRAILSRMFPGFSNRFIETGSPRVDLWTRAFAEFWGKPEVMPDQPYVLVTSNFVNANNYKRYWEMLATNRDLGYGDRDEAMEADFFGRLNEEAALVHEFQKAVRELAERMPHLDFVVRPHPVEDPKAWRKLLPRRDNVYVIREGPITPWVINAVAVVHNGCTTGIEATLAGTPVFVYRPINQAYEYEYANRFGVIANTVEDLYAGIAEAARTGTANDGPRTPAADALRLLEERIHIGDDLASARMLTAWEQIGANLPDRRNVWPSIGRCVRSNECFRPPLRRLWYGIRGRRVRQISDYKFPALSGAECRQKVDRLCDCLALEPRPSAEKLGDRALVVTSAR